MQEKTWIRPDGQPGDILKLWPRVMAAVGAIAKSHSASGVPYRFRSIEDILPPLQGSMLELGVVVQVSVPEGSHDRVAGKNGTMNQSFVKIALTFIAPDGTSLVQEAMGEALDSSDKATGKAQTNAVKIALLNGLMTPTNDKKRDPDTARPEPDGGRWSNMATAVANHVNACVTAEQVAAILEGEAFGDLRGKERQEVGRLAASKWQQFTGRKWEPKDKGRQARKPPPQTG
jgi:hypothetical protein